MNARLQRLSAGLDRIRYGGVPVGLEKARLMTEAFRATEGMPTITRSAAAFEHLLAEATIFIEDGQLLAGNASSEPWGIELTHFWGTWPEEELDGLREAGFVLDDETRAEALALNSYWAGRSITSRMTSLYDDHRLWPYAQLGLVLPPFRSKEEGWGPGGLLGTGYGVQHEISNLLGTPHFDWVLQRGLLELIEDAQRELDSTKLFSARAVGKVDLLRASIRSLRAIIAFAERFAALAGELADAESDPRRRAELRRIAEACAHVPARRPRTFFEAVQAYWLTFLVLNPTGTLGMGRMDQLLYPFYRADSEAGTITREEAVEMLACLRIRDMQLIHAGASAHRGKWAGGSKWHNCVIGGQLADGTDATNELSFLLLDAVLECPTPHHTITLRIHDGTLPGLLRKALKVARTGIGFPAFTGDDGIISFLVAEGIPIELARCYSIAGCMSPAVDGQSRVVASPMVVMPRVLELAMNDGVDPRTSQPAGPRTGRFEDFASYDELFAAVRRQIAWCVERQVEFNNVTIRSVAERTPRAVESALFDDPWQSGLDVLMRTLPYENANLFNPIGMITTADSLTAIKRVVYDERRTTAAALRAALAADWQGTEAEQIRSWCAEAPKFGNDDPEADATAAALFACVAQAVVEQATVNGGRAKPSALTIGTSAWPGGALTGATADGRYAGLVLNEEAVTPSRGSERRGPWEVIASAAKIDQLPWQMIELDIRFTPDALAGDAIDNLADLIRHYCRSGGKHVQLSVIDREILRDAQRHPERHRDLIVRLGGTSTYFVQLERRLQDDIIERSRFDAMPAAPAATTVAR
jgi:pyruvate-formate lyase